MSVDDSSSIVCESNQVPDHEVVKSNEPPMRVLITICAFRPSHILHVYIIRNFSKLLFFFPLLGVIILGFGISVLSKPSAIFSRLQSVSDFKPACLAAGSCNAMQLSIEREMNMKREMIRDVAIKKYAITTTVISGDGRGLQAIYSTTKFTNSITVGFAQRSRMIEQRCFS
jgi:hypothetical protein